MIRRRIWLTSRLFWELVFDGHDAVPGSAHLLQNPPQIFVSTGKTKKKRKHGGLFTEPLCFPYKFFMESGAYREIRQTQRTDGKD
jgi:hypothetical protein